MIDKLGKSGSLSIDLFLMKSPIRFTESFLITLVLGAYSGILTILSKCNIWVVWAIAVVCIAIALLTRDPVCAIAAICMTIIFVILTELAHEAS